MKKLISTLFILFSVVTISFAQTEAHKCTKTEGKACCQKGAAEGKACCKKGAETSASADASAKPACCQGKKDCPKNQGKPCPQEAQGKKCCSADKASSSKCSHHEEAK